MQVLSSSSSSSTTTFQLQSLHFLLNNHSYPLKTLKFQPLGRNLAIGRATIRCCRSRNHFGDREEDEQNNHLNKKEKSSSKTPEPLYDDEISNITFSSPSTIVPSAKEKICEVMHHFIAFLKKHIEIVIRPAADGGADVGLRLHIEWREKDLDLGHGCTLDLSHVYTGRVFLRNGKALLDSILKWKPSKLIGKERQMKDVAIVLEKMMKAKYLPKERKTLLIGLSYLFSSLIYMIVIFMLKNIFT